MIMKRLSLVLIFSLILLLSSFQIFIVEEIILLIGFFILFFTIINLISEGMSNFLDNRMSEIRNKIVLYKILKKKQIKHIQIAVKEIDIVKDQIIEIASWLQWASNQAEKNLNSRLKNLYSKKLNNVLLTYLQAENNFLRSLSLRLSTYINLIYIIRKSVIVNPENLVKQYSFLFLEEEQKQFLLSNFKENYWNSEISLLENKLSLLKLEKNYIEWSKSTLFILFKLNKWLFSFQNKFISYLVILQLINFKFKSILN